MSKPSNSKNGMTDEEKLELDEAYNACHSHTNTSVLAAITAAFTTAMKTAVNNLISGIVTSALSVAGTITCASTGTSKFAGGLDIEGYSILGELSPGVKIAKISGTTPGLGSTSNYVTNISADKAISLSMLVSDSDAIWRIPAHGIQNTATEYYLCYIGTNGKLYIEIPAESTKVYSCAFVATILYTP